MDEMKGKKSFIDKFKVPHTYVIIFYLVVLVAALTYIIPAGQFERAKDVNTGKTLIIVESFKYVDRNPAGIIDILRSFIVGLNKSADIVFFIFVVGGAFQIISSTGTIEAITGRIAKKFMNRENVIIPIFLVLFSIFGFTMGMSTEVMIFVPLGIVIARTLGFDAITGTAMIALGAACGFTAGLLNPFNVGIAQSIAEVPLFSGLWLRAVLLVFLLVATSLYILKYAKKIKNNPELSIVRELEKEEAGIASIDLDNLKSMTTSNYLVILTLVAGFGSIIWGVSKDGWWIEELSTAFLAMGILSGLFSKYGPSHIAREFVNGAKSIVFGALIVGIARSVLVVMEDASIIDTVVRVLADSISHLPNSVAALGMYAVQIIINTFITSGSGQAATTMPIMTPLADLLGVTRQTAVLAFQLGDGFTNSILPTSSALMGYLAVSKIPYEKWVKFIVPLLGIWIAIGAVFVLVATAVGY
ncbi:MAG: TIGR00366 family protein [Sedimentibacter sp.]|uniref:YfcC family protein n=1 Tax=Sedimentibacter sp. TaxID=1960295 RepID=UPI003158A364